MWSARPTDLSSFGERSHLRVCACECQEQLCHLPCLIISTLYKWSPSGHYLNKKRTKHSQTRTAAEIEQERICRKDKVKSDTPLINWTKEESGVWPGLLPAPGVENEIFGRSGFNKTLITYPQKLPHFASFRGYTILSLIHSKRPQNSFMASFTMRVNQKNI